MPEAASTRRWPWSRTPKIQRGYCSRCGALAEGKRGGAWWHVDANDLPACHAMPGPIEFSPLGNYKITKSFYAHGGLPAKFVGVRSTWADHDAALPGEAHD